MGKFEGFLICSDIDGTFTGTDEIISANKKAVRYFIGEGGKFTFTTGRNADHLQKIGLLDCINAPACIVNGSIIYDCETKKVLREIRLPFSVGEFMERIREFSPSYMGITAHNGCEDGERVSFYKDSISDDIINIKPLKIVCRFHTVEDADTFRERALNAPDFGDCYIAKSWNTGVEFNSLSATKGEAIKFIKEYLGTIHTSVGIGDYENDIPLLQGADIGVAVENALDSVKVVSDIIVKRNTECAIADLIDMLEKRKDNDN